MLMESSGAMETVSIILVLDFFLSPAPVASCQARAAAAASSRFRSSSSDRNSSLAALGS